MMKTMDVSHIFKFLGQIACDCTARLLSLTSLFDDGTEN